MARPRTRMIGARGRGLPSNCFFFARRLFFARRVDLYFSFPVSIFSCPASIFFARHLLVFARRLSTAGLSSGNTSRVRNLFFVARRSSTASASSENTSRLRNLFFCPAALHSKPSPVNLSLENTSRFIRPPASLQFMSYMFCLRNVNTISQFSPPVVSTHSLRKLNRSHTSLSFRPIGRASHCALSMHDGRVPGSPHLCVIRPHSRCEAWVLNMMKPVGVLGTGHVQSS